MLRELTVVAVLCAAPSLFAQEVRSFDPPAAFGARQSVSDLRLSPDGQRVSYIAPTDGQGSVVYTLSLDKGARRERRCVPPASRIDSRTATGSPRSAWPVRYTLSSKTPHTGFSRSVGGLTGAAASAGLASASSFF